MCILAFVSAAGAAPQTDAEASADAILKGAAEYLAGKTRFSVTIRDGYDVVQASGQKIEFGDMRKILVKRPDQLRVDVEASDGAGERSYSTARNSPPSTGPTTSTPRCPSPIARAGATAQITGGCPEPRCITPRKHG